MPTTIYDVARLAGVSIGTASRVINNRSNVKPMTREKVLHAIAELDYRPNPIARSMISKRTGSVGVIVPFFTRFFFMEVLRGIATTLAQMNRDLVLYNIETNAQRDRYFTEIPMLHKVDGVVILSLTPEDAVASSFVEKEMPVVLIDAYSPYLRSLVIDNVGGAYQAVKCLIKQGHQRIGFINGIIEGNFKFNQANDRLIGFHQALSEAGLLFEPELVLATEWNRQGGKKAAMQLLSHKKRPTAIFAASDIQATGVLDAAKAFNLAVPTDLSVIGYDGIEISELLELTTVQQPMYEMGQLGVYKLIELIENPMLTPDLTRLGTRLIERRTTSQAPLLA